jgi:hypothetical protein
MKSFRIYGRKVMSSSSLAFSLTNVLVLLAPSNNEINLVRHFNVELIFYQFGGLAIYINTSKQEMWHAIAATKVFHLQNLLLKQF